MNTVFFFIEKFSRKFFLEIFHSNTKKGFFFFNEPRNILFFAIDNFCFICSFLFHLLSDIVSDSFFSLSLFVVTTLSIKSN